MTAQVNSTAKASDHELIIERLFDAPRELVFEAWTGPEHVTQWWGPKDFTLSFCEMDFREGGSYRYCMRSPEQTDHWVWGEYKKIVRPEEIVLTWNRENVHDEITSSTTVTVSFQADGDRTRFRLYQARFETVENRDGHAFGWSQCLDRLATYSHEIFMKKGESL